MPPTQTRKSGETSIGRDPIVSGLYRQRRQVGIRNQITRRVCGAAKLIENSPVTQARLHDHTTRMHANLLYKSERHIKGRLGRGIPWDA